MSKQIYFDFIHNNELDINSFFVNKTNQEAYQMLTSNVLLSNIILIGPKKSGKSHLANIWQKNNKAIRYKFSVNKIIYNNKNLIIEDLFVNFDEEKIFHTINHCTSNKLKILITSNIDIFEYEFKIPDLLSRLKIFNYVVIKKPDDEILINVLTKLLIEKQFIIKNIDIFDYLIKRLNRTYEDVYNIVEKLDKLSLEKKRQLTIPLIQELI